MKKFENPNTVLFVGTHKEVSDLWHNAEGTYTILDNDGNLDSEAAVLGVLCELHKEEGYWYCDVISQLDITLTLLNYVFDTVEEYEVHRYDYSSIEWDW